MKSFATSLGLDIIIPPQGDPVLIELQHHFGRQGMMELYPVLRRDYRKQVASMRARFGASEELREALRRACRNKIRTYRLLPDLQPSSVVYQGWTRKVEKWRDSLTSPWVLTKPPCGSCGRGIKVFSRESLGEGFLDVPLSGPLLLQEFLSSKPLRRGDGLAHVGCIRHIVFLTYEQGRLGLLHWPPYWRVAPAPFTSKPEREAFTANISNGATPLAVSEEDFAVVRQFTEVTVRRLLGALISLPVTGVVSSRAVLAEGGAA